MRILINEKLSEHKMKTPEGYLICTDAILARTGKQDYMKKEVFDGCDDEDMISINRKEDDVFKDETIASFENKPITWDHPNENVTPENYRQLSVGYVRNVRKANYEGQPVMVGDLVITDADAIKQILDGEHTELSCGYDCDIVQDGEDYKQSNIRGNHIALCEQGRAGIARIVDSKVKDGRRIQYEDDLVIVTCNGQTVYKGLLDDFSWFHDDDFYDCFKWTNGQYECTENGKKYVLKVLDSANDSIKDAKFYVGISKYDYTKEQAERDAKKFGLKLQIEGKSHDPHFEFDAYMIGPKANIIKMLKSQDMDEFIEEIEDSIKDSEDDFEYMGVSVWKGDDGKWHDSNGNRYMGYLTPSDIKHYIRKDLEHSYDSINDAWEIKKVGPYFRCYHNGDEVEEFRSEADAKHFIAQEKKHHNDSTLYDEFAESIVIYDACNDMAAKPEEVDSANYVVGNNGVWFARAKGEKSLLTKAYCSNDKGKTWHTCNLEVKTENKAHPGQTQAGKYFFRTASSFDGPRTAIGRNVLTWYAAHGEHNYKEGYQIDHIDNNYRNDELSNLQRITREENLRKMKEYQKSKHHDSIMNDDELSRNKQLAQQINSKFAREFKKWDNAEVWADRDGLCLQEISGTGSLLQKVIQYVKTKGYAVKYWTDGGELEILDSINDSNDVLDAVNIAKIAKIVVKAKK